MIFQSGYLSCMVCNVFDETSLIAEEIIADFTLVGLVVGVVLHMGGELFCVCEFFLTNITDQLMTQLKIVNNACQEIDGSELCYSHFLKHFQFKCVYS